MENNVIVQVETKRTRQERGRATSFLSQWIEVATEAFLTDGRVTAKFIFK